MMKYRCSPVSGLYVFRGLFNVLTTHRHRTHGPGHERQIPLGHTHRTVHAICRNLVRELSFVQELVHDGPPLPVVHLRLCAFLSLRPATIHAIPMPFSIHPTIFGNVQGARTGQLCNKIFRGSFAPPRH